jgi:hypothetical protein
MLFKPRWHGIDEYHLGLHIKKHIGYGSPGAPHGTSKSPKREEASKIQVLITESFRFAQKAFMVHHQTSLPQDFEKGFSKNCV